MSTKKIILTATAIAALAGPAAAQARQGADDPVGHVRHSAGDDVRGAHHTSAATHRHRARHGRRGVHHSATGVRRGGADDGPNHT
jgi:Ni/Co efflux regulator RcnB